VHVIERTLVRRGVYHCSVFIYPYEKKYVHVIIVICWKYSLLSSAVAAEQDKLEQAAGSSIHGC